MLPYLLLNFHTKLFLISFKTLILQFFVGTIAIVAGCETERESMTKMKIVILTLKRQLSNVDIEKGLFSRKIFLNIRKLTDQIHMFPKKDGS